MAVQGVWLVAGSCWDPGFGFKQVAICSVGGILGSIVEHGSRRLMWQLFAVQIAVQFAVRILRQHTSRGTSGGSMGKEGLSCAVQFLAAEVWCGAVCQ